MSKYVYFGDLNYGDYFYYNGELCYHAGTEGYNKVCVRDLSGRKIAVVDDLTTVETQ